MMSSGKTMVCLLSALALSMGAKALVSDQPNAAYHNIVDRNAFGLKSPPDPKTLTAPVTVDPLPKITLTGITTVLGRKIAFLTVASKKSGVPPEAFMLTEGQGQGEIQVEQIDEMNGVVRVLNHGEKQILDFDRDDAKPGELHPDKIPSPRAITSSPSETSLTAEETAALMAIQTEKYRMNGDPTHKIMPPISGLTASEEQSLP